MRIRTIVITACFVCLLQTAHAQTGDEARRGADSDSNVAIVSLGKPVVNDKTLTWRYQVRNGSAKHIWLCDRVGESCCEAHMVEDNETLLIQRRLDLPIGFGLPPTGKYVRLRKGETRTELMSFTLPIRPRYALSNRRPDQPQQYASRLTLEISYYAGDLPRMVCDMLCQAKMPPEGYPPDLPFEKYDPSFFFPGRIMTFLGGNEGQARGRNEGVVIPYTWQTLKGENILRLDADSLRIPYLEQDKPVTCPDLTQCTRIEITLRPHALEFFFPYVDEQSLFNLTEKQYLESLDAVVIEAPKLLKALAEELHDCLCGDAFVSEHVVAELTCYRGNKETLTSLRIYDGPKVMNQEGQVFGYLGSLVSMRSSKAEIGAFDLRVRCAANMRDLWHRLRLYHIVRYGPSDLEEYWKRYTTNRQIFPPEAFEEHEKTYPQATSWCDAMLQGYRVNFTNDLEAGRILRCPGDGTGKGKSYYAMNPNCRYDSPPDMVLLFETKPGWIRGRWNQHAGPELFTFDNHDPKGGLVLLNDGTVKFIRTEEELKQLRWK